jgi:hypothetical protein
VHSSDNWTSINVFFLDTPVSDLLLFEKKHGYEKKLLAHFLLVANWVSLSCWFYSMMISFWALQSCQRVARSAASTSQLGFWKSCCNVIYMVVLQRKDVGYAYYVVNHASSTANWEACQL